jgi:hypothetical protein
MRKFCITGIFLSATFSAPAFAQTLAQQQAALKAISQTASEICTTAPIHEQHRNVELTGDAKAKLDGVVGKIVGLGLQGAAKYSSGNSRGVLQKDLAKALKDGNDCRLTVFNTLAPKMVGTLKTTDAAKPRVPTVFKKPDGYFKKQGASWVEYPAYALNQFFTFQETGEDGSYIYLSDGSRSKPGSPGNSMIVRLPITGGSADWSYQNPVIWTQFTVVTPQ